MGMKPARETDLYEPLRIYLERQGYAVRGEVNGCDVTARKGDDLIVVELKRQFGLDLLIQATQRHAIADSVYVAVPRPERLGPRWKGIKRVLRRLEVGLIFVTFTGRNPRVEIVFHPAPYQGRKSRKERRAVIEEMERRSGDHNRGGSNRAKLVTAYRENAVHIACCLEKHGPLKPRDLRALGTGLRTLSILRNNVYGWFERIERGVYGVTERGRAGLEEFHAIAAEYRQRIRTSEVEREETPGPKNRHEK
jgi:hypothetical protein